MSRVNTIINAEGQTLRIVDDVREIWSNPLSPYSECGAKLVGYEIIGHSQTIDGESVSDESVAQFGSKAHLQLDKLREQEERAQLARLSKKYGDERVGNV